MAQWQDWGSHHFDWRVSPNDDSLLRWCAGKTLSFVAVQLFSLVFKSCDPIPLPALQLCSRCTCLTCAKMSPNLCDRWTEEQTADLFLHPIKQSVVARSSQEVWTLSRQCVCDCLDIHMIYSRSLIIFLYGSFLGLFTSSFCTILGQNRNFSA